MGRDIVLRRKITDRIRYWYENGGHECLLVTGARQVGKTYIIREFLEENFDSFAYLDLSGSGRLCSIFERDSDVDRIVSAISDLMPAFDPVPGKTALFFDEIQECPAARTALKAFALDGRYRVVASGSLMGLLYRLEGHNPVGYEWEISMRSLDFEEFLWALGVKDDTILRLRRSIHDRESLEDAVLDRMQDLFRIYTVVGGMPEAVKAYISGRNPDDVRHVHEKLISGYRYDIGKYSKASERDRIFHCLDSVPYQLGRDNKKFMFSRIDPEEKSPSARTYDYGIQWLSDSGIVTKCRRISQPKMPLELSADTSAFKLYLHDTGLMMSMMDPEIRDAFVRGDTRVNKGSVMENEVAECISKCGHKLYYFDNGSLEVDFITVMHGVVTAIEVKSGNNRRAKSLDSIGRNYGVRRRMKFEDTNIHVDDGGIEHYPLFAAAFIDSMYDSRKADLDPGDIDGLNRLMSGS